MDSFIINAFLHPSGAQTVILTLIFAWSLFWKALSLWRSAKSDDKLWFIVLMVVNTVGLLEIAYIFYLSKNKLKVEEVRSFISSLDLSKLKFQMKNKKDSRSPQKLTKQK